MENLKEAASQDLEMSINKAAEEQVKIFNSAKGEGSCPICNGKGFIAKVVDGYERVGYCSCMRQKINNDRIQKSGLAEVIDKYTFDNFETRTEWQSRFKRSALNFSKEPKGWFYVGGQSGCGKTHICTAIVKSFMDKGMDCKYVIWTNEILKLKANKNNDEEYNRIMQPLQRAKVLYIDDFFKLPSGMKATPTQSEIVTAFELLNYRYNMRSSLITIISSEFAIDDLIYFDEALGSRIYEMTKGNRIIIKMDKDRNYRLVN